MVEVIKESGSSTPPEGGESNVEGKIEIEGKVFTKADVENLVKMQKGATEKSQQVAAVLSAAEKYGVDPETYVDQAEGAFGALTKLIDEGLIDNKGNVLKKEIKEDPLKGKEEEVDLEELLGLSGSSESKIPKGLDKVAAVIQKALEPQLEVTESLKKKVETIDKTQGEMIRLSLQEKILEKYPTLSPKDVSQVFARAMDDKSKGMWDHAKDLNSEKEVELKGLRRQHAEEFGIDLEKFDENKMLEQDSKGGAGVLYKGKKFSFQPEKEGEDVDPRKAAMEYIERVKGS